MKILLLGLGNPILSDDSVGLRVTQILQNLVNQPEVTTLESSVAGLDFIDLLTGYEKVIIIDATQTRGGKVGQIYRSSLGDLAATRHSSTPHDINLATAIELGNRLNLPLPKDIVIFAIEVKDVTTLGEECTTEVEQAIPLCVDMVVAELASRNPN